MDVKRMRFHRCVDEIPLFHRAAFDDNVGVRRKHASEGKDRPEGMLVEVRIRRVRDVVAVVDRNFALLRKRILGKREGPSPHERRMCARLGNEPHCRRIRDHGRRGVRRHA